MRSPQTAATDASRAFGPGSPRRAGPRAMSALALGSLLLAACGTVDHPAPDHKLLTGVAPKLSSRLRAQEQTIHEQVTASLHQTNATQRYGGIPGFIPKSTLPVNRIVTATVAHPALAIQGDGVRLDSAQGTTIATAVGPEVPDRYQGSFHNSAPVSFDLSFAKVHGTIPIAPSMFVITDELGTILHPRLSVAGGGPVPADVPAGRPFTLVLKTKLPIGTGNVEYAPTGGHWLAEWNFDVETD